MESPEIHTPHHGHGGVRWLEITASIAALVVSFASIFIALQHGKTMEKLVTANSMPYVDAGFSNSTEDGKPRLMINMFNKGVGPAHEISFKVKVGGRYMRNVDDMLAATFGANAGAARAALRPYSNTQRTRFIPARDKQIVYFMDKTPENASYWEKLNGSMGSLSAEICYCSVFEECWKRLDDNDPVPVKQCVRDEPNEFKP
jgi:hypothetical protein